MQFSSLLKFFVLRLKLLKILVLFDELIMENSHDLDDLFEVLGLHHSLLRILGTLRGPASL